MTASVTAGITPFGQAALDAALPPKAAPPAAGTEAATPPATDSTDAAAVTPPAAEVPPAAAEPTAQERARAAADALVAKRAKQRRDNAERDARVRGLEQQAAADRAAREAAERKLKDPMALVREQGLDRAVQQAAIDESTPEGQIAKLRADLEAEKARNAERDRREQAHQAAASQNAQQRAYLAAGTAKDGDEPKYPYIAAMAAVDPRGVIKYALDLVERARERGEVPTNADLLETQEWLYSQAAAKAARKPPVEAPAEVPPAAPPAARKPATASLTGRKVPPPAVTKTFGQMTRDEQMAYMAAQLKKTAIEV